MPSLLQQAARGTLLLGVGHLCLTLSGYVVALVLARALGPAAYGVYGIVYSVLLTTELVARLGVPQALSRLIAESDARDRLLEGTAITLTLAVYLTLFALFWIAAPWLAEAFNVPNGTLLFRIAAIDIPFYGGYIVTAHILNGRRQFGTESLAAILYSFGKVAGVLLVWAYGASVEAALLANVLSSALAFLFAGWRSGADAFRPTLVKRTPLLRLALPIALASVGVQLLISLDLWALNAFGEEVAREVKGLYVAATNLARLPTLLAFVMASVLVPSVARAMAMGDTDLVRRTVTGAMRFVSLSLLPLTVIIAVEAGPLLSLMFSPAYAAGAPLLTVLVVAHGLGNTLFAILTSILLAAGREKASARAALVAAAAAAVVNPVLVLLLGAQGAALGALLTTLGPALFAALLAHRVARGLVEPQALAKAALATALVALAAYLTPSEGTALLVELAVLGLVYLALLPLLRLVTRADLGLLLSPRATP